MGVAKPGTSGMRERWLPFDAAVEEVAATTGCRTGVAGPWLRQQVDDGRIGVRALEGAAWDGGGPSANGQPPHPAVDGEADVRLSDVDRALAEFPASEWGPGCRSAWSGVDGRERVRLPEIARLFAEAQAEQGGTGPKLDFWRWLRGQLDAGRLDPLGNVEDCTKVRTPTVLLPDQTPLDEVVRIGTAQARDAAIKRVEFHEDEVRRWLPNAQPAPSSAAVPAKRGPKQQWPWSKIIARAAVDYAESVKSGRPIAWKQLTENIRDLAEELQGRRPGPSTAGAHAKEIMAALDGTR